MRGSLQRSLESSSRKGDNVIILGAILMILGLVFGIPILWTVGIVLLVVGLVLMLLGRGGRQIGGRAHYY
jgi:VIT1/CCC1 family predicted Fe2+/Mn2+ transporter